MISCDSELKQRLVAYYLHLSEAISDAHFFSWRLVIKASYFHEKRICSGRKISDCTKARGASSF